MATTSPITRSWKQMSIPANILRLWLGITWIYAGWNKATDSGFLNQASPHYIGAQLDSYLPTSPIAFFLRHLIEHATLIGWVTLLGEFAIGFALLAGVAMQLAALGGFALSLTFWLSSTWSVKPYFLGSDTAYMAMWLALFFAIRQSSKGRKSDALIPNLSDRREVVRLAGVAALAVAGAFLGSKFRAKNPTPEAGAAITTVSALPVGGVFKFVAADGQPAILFRTKAGVFAYSRICTHQGCTVDYNASANALQCPCHGAQFDPTAGAKVTGGPAPRPLASIKVAIKGDKIVQI